MDVRQLTLYGETVFMAENPYRGEVFIHLGPRDRLPLVYNWDAIARIRETWPDAQYDLLDVRDLSRLIAIGLIHVDPRWTAGEIMKASPPLQPAAEAVAMAIYRAQYGKTKPYPTQENPPKPGLMRTLWKKLCELAPQWGSRRANFGA